MEHISDWYGDEPNPTNQQVSMPELQQTTEDDDDSVVHVHQVQEHADFRGTLCSIQQSSALFLMGLKEERKLTQMALQGVVEGATSFPT